MRTIVRARLVSKGKLRCLRLMPHDCSHPVTRTHQQVQGEADQYYRAQQDLRSRLLYRERRSRGMLCRSRRARDRDRIIAGRSASASSTSAVAAAAATSASSLEDQAGEHHTVQHKARQFSLLRPLRAETESHERQPANWQPKGVEQAITSGWKSQSGPWSSGRNRQRGRCAGVH